MINFLFTIGIIILFFKVLRLALRAAWGLTKVALFVFAFPAILVGLFVTGLVVIAIPLLLIGLLVSFIAPVVV